MNERAFPTTAGEQVYADRFEAGRELAARLLAYRGREDIQVLALPRGGVPVAWEVARVLTAPLDGFLVRKLGVPGQKELAMGAIASGGLRVLNEENLRMLGIPSEAVEKVTREEQSELARQGLTFRGDRPFPELAGRTILLIDDGMATGATMRAAAQALRILRPARIVAAVPVAALETCLRLSGDVDEMVCARTPDPFLAVGYWYRDFSPIGDDQVRALLRSSREMAPGLSR